MHLKIINNKKLKIKRNNHKKYNELYLGKLFFFLLKNNIFFCSMELPHLGEHCQESTCKTLGKNLLVS